MSVSFSGAGGGALQECTEVVWDEARGDRRRREQKGVGNGLEPQSTRRAACVVLCAPGWPLCLLDRGKGGARQGPR